MNLDRHVWPDRPQLSDEAADFVRALIMSGELQPGESVRAETIAEMLGVSATPARAALKALRVEGFLTLQPRRGFQVADLSARDIEDLFTVQALVAGELVARAARNRTQDDIEALRAIHTDLEAAAASGDTESLENLNHRFHKVVNRLGESPKILWVLGLLTRYVPRMFYGSIPGWPESTIEGHGAIPRGDRRRRRRGCPRSDARSPQAVRHAPREPLRASDAAGHAGQGGIPALNS